MKRIITSALISLATVSTAFALDNSYISIGAGGVASTHNGNISNNSDIIFYSPTPAGDGAFGLPYAEWANHYSNGYDVNLALGGDLSSNFRGEVEYLYQHMNRKIHGNYDWLQLVSSSGDTYAPQVGIPISGSSTNLRVYSLLANVMYDFKNTTKWTPALGFGLGYGHVNSNGTTVYNSMPVVDSDTGIQTTASTIVLSPSYSSSVLAWQFKAGLAYQMNKHFSIVGQYRLFGTTPFLTSDSSVTANPGAGTQGQFRVNGKSISGIINNGFDISLRYAFG